MRTILFTGKVLEKRDPQYLQIEDLAPEDKRKKKEQKKYNTIPRGNSKFFHWSLGDYFLTLSFASTSDSPGTLNKRVANWTIVSTP